MNIYDISQKSGVSIATVSRVLNNSKNVSEKTRRKVLAVMEEEDYQPNAFARGLMLNTMQTIGLLCSDSSDPYLGRAISFLEQGLRGHSYDSLLCCTGYDSIQKEKCTDMLLSRHVDALIFIGSNFIERTDDKNAYLYRAASQVPVIILNGYLKGTNIYSVLCDDVEASYSAARRFFKSGFRHPVFLSRSSSFSGVRKQTGFEKACQEAGFPPGPDQLLQSSGPLKEVCDMLARHYQTAPFDALLATDDELAVGALKFAQKAGLSVPKDLAVVGYNNSLLSICCEPELTSIDNRLEYLCSTSVTLLMNLMAGKKVPEKTEISAELVLRSTTPEHF
ncbi:MAG: LacI family DNA-binding transcriptional regulator [Candidatus Limivivens sp.]|nr:LacI family DNA-binding transcriptional regulator [Candidatus Limivivens sp.]